MASGAEHLRAGPDVVREVAHHVVFRIAAHLMRVGGDGEQGVLPPVQERKAAVSDIRSTCS